MTSEAMLLSSIIQGTARVDLCHVRVRISLTHTQVGP
jgi:subtilisin-like proprotein convertase family protein